MLKAEGVVEMLRGTRVGFIRKDGLRNLVIEFTDRVNERFGI